MEVELINQFKGKYDFLSNFYKCPVLFEGILYQSVEHAYQAAKSFDTKYRYTIQLTKEPGQAKRKGRTVKLRPDWEIVKDNVMRMLLTRKFQLPHLRKLLLATGDAQLVEGNYWHDNYWGDCFCKSCLDTPGQNKLGKALMEIRQEIIEDGKEEVHGQIQRPPSSN